MSKVKEKLIQAYTVLYYAYLIDENKGLTLEDIPVVFKNEVEIRANEKFIKEYQKVSDSNV